MNDIELLKQSRKILDMTQKQLALKLEVAHITVRQWESGSRKPRNDIFRTILELIVERAASTAERQGFIDEIAKKLNQK